MTFDRIILTSYILKQKIRTTKNRYQDFKLNSFSKVKNSHMNFLKDMVDGNFIYCTNCNCKINEEFVGKTIVINKRTGGRFTKWYCESCAELKNIVVV